MSDDSLASGGKTWSFPTNTTTTVAPTAPKYINNFQDFLYFGFLSLLAAMGVMGFFLMFINITDWDLLNIIAPSIKNDVIVSATEGYSAASAPNSLFIIVIILILFAANKVILCMQLWSKKKIRIALIFLFILSTFSAATVANGSIVFNKSETTSTQWMQDRYGFSTDNPERSQVLNDGEYLYDSETKTIAKVQKQNNKFYLYGTDGKELPIK